MAISSAHSTQAKSLLRIQLLEDWLQLTLGETFKQLSPLAGDASFRRYFRVHCSDLNYIAMDAPPDKESCASFIAMAKAFLTLGLNVPELIAVNLDQGFLLLTDFGDRLYLDELNKQTADPLYSKALQKLLLIQSYSRSSADLLPNFDEALYLRELSLFKDWYLEKYLKKPLTVHQEQTFKTIGKKLITMAMAQPQVCVHRDYHSRNLMLVDEAYSPAILDFQDAVWGPITYDLVSLLRDCYIDWPEDQVTQWALEFRQSLSLVHVSESEFIRWFDWMGVQRHLKCLGIFARLHCRDGKSNYLQYIPRIIRYIHRVCEKYPELNPLLKLSDL